MENPYAAPLAHPVDSGNGPVTAATIAALAGTKFWVRFFSVMSWIGIVGMLVAGGAMATVLGPAMASQQAQNPLGDKFGLILGLCYVVMAAIYVYPALKLGSYASCIHRLKSSRGVADLEAALDEQRRFWKFAGIIMMLFLALYGLAIAAAVVVSVVTAVNR